MCDTLLIFRQGTSCGFWDSPSSSLRLCSHKKSLTQEPAGHFSSKPSIYNTHPFPSAKYYKTFSIKKCVSNLCFGFLLILFFSELFENEFAGFSFRFDLFTTCSFLQILFSLSLLCSEIGGQLKKEYSSKLREFSMMMSRQVSHDNICHANIWYIFLFLWDAKFFVQHFDFFLGYWGSIAKYFWKIKIYFFVS